MEQEREDRGEGHEKGTRASLADGSLQAVVDVRAVGAEGRGTARYARKGGGEKIEEKDAEQNDYAQIREGIFRERCEGRGGVEGEDGKEGEISHRKAERGRACVAEKKDGARTVVGEKAEQQCEQGEGERADLPTDGQRKQRGKRDAEQQGVGAVKEIGSVGNGQKKEEGEKEKQRALAAPGQDGREQQDGKLDDELHGSGKGKGVVERAEQTNAPDTEGQGEVRYSLREQRKGKQQGEKDGETADARGGSGMQTPTARVIHDARKRRGAREKGSEKCREGEEKKKGKKAHTKYEPPRVRTVFCDFAI